MHDLAYSSQPEWTRAGSGLGASKPARELLESGPWVGNRCSSLRKCPAYRSCLLRLQNTFSPNNSQHTEKLNPEACLSAELQENVALGSSGDCGAFGMCREASANGKIWIYKLSVRLHQKGSTNKIQNSYLLSLSTYSKGFDGTKKSNSFATARVQYIKRDFPGGTVVKNPPAKAGDTGSSPGPGRSHMPQSN